MNLKQITELCNAYQRCIYVEELINKSIKNMLDVDRFEMTLLIKPIKDCIINYFCCGVKNDKYKEMVCECLENDEPQQLYNLFYLMYGVCN